MSVLPPDPAEHVIMSALKFREERDRRGGTQPTPEQPKPNGQVLPLPYFTASTAKGRQKVREFLDSGNIFPQRNVAILSGDGGTGKSLLAMQLAIACTTGTQWIGMDVAQCPVVYFSAEDDEQEIINRLNEIADADGVNLEEAWQLHVLPRVGGDTVLASEQKDGILKPTALYESLCVTLEQLTPGLLILDNLADVFSGNENSRTAAKQFIGKLRWLCIKFDCVILLIAHPSLTGRSSGTGESGSTGWNNSVRVRCYLSKLAEPDANQDERVFEVKKANYGPAGIRYSLLWKNERFIRQEQKDPLAGITPDDPDRIREVFATFQYRTDAQATNWGGYAAAKLLNLDAGQGVGPKERSQEQNHNRDKIKRWLAMLVRNRVIYVVKALNAKREEVMFYSAKEEPS